MITEALRPYKNHLEMHFFSNVDAPTSPRRSRRSIRNHPVPGGPKTFTTQESTDQRPDRPSDWFIKSCR